MESKVYQDTVIISSHWREDLSDDHAEFLDYLFKQFRRYHSAQNHQDNSTERDINVVKSFVVFTQRAPWFCEEDDFIDWCIYLRNTRKLKSQTMVTYQGVVRRFTEYYSENVKLHKQIREKYGVNAKPVCDRTLCIPHPRDTNASGNKPAFSHDEFEKILVTLDEAIDVAEENHLKSFLPLVRDKVLYYVAYALSLRSCEATTLTINSFHEDPSRPQFGRYGMAFVSGKGHSGTGKKTRPVPIKNVYVPAMLDHYIKAVRPLFLTYADSEETCLFLSERGKPLSYRAYHHNFHEHLDRAGLGGLGYSTHTLRRTGLTHAALWMNICTVQELAGHADPGTTGRYVTIPKAYTRNQLNGIYEKQIQIILERGE